MDGDPPFDSTHDARKAMPFAHVLLCALLAAVLGLLPAAGAIAQELRFFRLGTGTTGGTYFPIGGIIAGAISGPPGSPPCELGGSCGVPGLIAVAQASSGSVENVNAVRDGLMESALTQADIAYWAYTGTGLYAENGAAPDLRAIAHLYNELVHVVVPADSPVETVSDLRGLRVSLGDEGSGTLIDARIILEAYGLSEDDIEAVHMQPEPSSDAVMRGELDAFVFVGGAPLLAVADLARRIPIRLIPFDDDVTEQLLDELPFFTRAAIPENAYEGVEPVPTLAVGAILVTSGDIDEETVYGITRALWHPTTRTLLANGHPRGSDIQLANALRGIALPIHSGALRFYREAGLVNAEDASVH